MTGQSKSDVATGVHDKTQAVDGALEARYVCAVIEQDFHTTPVVI